MDGAELEEDWTTHGIFLKGYTCIYELVSQSIFYRTYARAYASLEYWGERSTGFERYIGLYIYIYIYIMQRHIIIFNYNSNRL